MVLISGWRRGRREEGEERKERGRGGGRGGEEERGRGGGEKEGSRSEGRCELLNFDQYLVLSATIGAEALKSTPPLDDNLLIT